MRASFVWTLRLISSTGLQEVLQVRLRRLGISLGGIGRHLGWFAMVLNETLRLWYSIPGFPIATADGCDLESNEIFIARANLDRMLVLGFGTVIHETWCLSRREAWLSYGEL